MSVGSDASYHLVCWRAGEAKVRKKRVGSGRGIKRGEDIGSSYFPRIIASCTVDTVYPRLGCLVLRYILTITSIASEPV